MVTVLMPLPAADFDPTEVAVSWQVLAAAGHDVVFATPSGQRGRADDLMVTGQGLDPWGFVPGLRRLTVVGRVLRADADARRAYAALLEDEAFAAPLHWGAARRSAYDALVLPGGHRARGMRPYLESPEVQQMAIDAFRAEKPVGAICHGVLVAARAVDPVTERSVLYGRRTTALTWALEDKAWGIARFTRFWDRDYYRTYMEEPGQRWGYLSVQQEVTRALADPGRLRRRGEGLAGLATEVERARPRHADRRAPRLRRARRLLRVGSLARRRAHLRPDLRGGPGGGGLTVSRRSWCSAGPGRRR